MWTGVLWTILLAVSPKMSRGQLVVEECTYSDTREYCTQKE